MSTENQRESIWFNATMIAGSILFFVLVAALVDFIFELFSPQKPDRLVMTYDAPLEEFYDEARTWCADSDVPINANGSVKTFECEGGASLDTCKTVGWSCRYIRDVYRPPAYWSEMVLEAWTNEYKPEIHARLTEFDPEIACIVDFDALPYRTDILYAATDGPKVKAWYEAELNRFEFCINEKRSDKTSMAAQFLYELFFDVQEKHHLENKEYLNAFQQDPDNHTALKILMERFEESVAKEHKAHKRKLRRHVDEVIAPAYAEGRKIDHLLEEEEAEKRRQADAVLERERALAKTPQDGGWRNVLGALHNMAEQRRQAQLEEQWRLANEQAKAAEFLLRQYEAKKGEILAGDQKARSEPKAENLPRPKSCVLPPINIPFCDTSPGRDPRYEGCEAEVAAAQARKQRIIREYAARPECTEQVQILMDKRSETPNAKTISK